MGILVYSLLWGNAEIYIINRNNVGFGVWVFFPEA